MLWGQGHNDVVDTRHFFSQSSRNYHDFPLTFPDTLAFPDFPRSGNPGKNKKRHNWNFLLYHASFHGHE